MFTLQQILLLIVLTLTNSSFAGSCEDMAKLDSKKFIENRVADFSCQANWYEKKVLRSIELLHLKKTCIEREGGFLIDCLLTRTCSSEGDKFSRSGIPLYLIESSMKYLCVAGDHYLYGNESDSGVKVFVRCLNEKAQHLVIQTPSGKIKKCQLPSISESK